MKLLIVDDDILLCSALSRPLVRLDHAARTATSVELALALFEAEEPDAVLTDLDLGVGGNGVDLIRRLRMVDRALPAVLMTGSEPEGARSQLNSAGLGDISILEKPFTFDDLMTKLRQLLPNLSVPAGRAPPPTSMAAMMGNVLRAFGGRAP